jgi:virginiamycin A acetyltransferase
MKRVARLLFRLIAIAPLLSFYVRSLFLGRQRAFQSSTQALALIPGLSGQYIRRAFLRVVTAGCDDEAVVEFGTTFSEPGVFIGPRAYVGPHCDIGLARIEADVLIAAGVHIPSGPATHAMVDPAVPIREQPGVKRLVRIGAGAWIGNNAVVMADVGVAAVIGAGAVVTAPIPDGAVAVGVPARVVRTRDARSESV